MKKALSLMITLAIVATMFVTVSIPAAAAWQDSITATQPAAYTGSEGEGYLITTPAEFMWLNGKNVTAYLGADIQIGNTSNPFTAPFGFSGKLIGINANDLYTITAYISTASGYTGLFKNLTSSAVIKNIELAGAIVSSSGDYIGGLAGAVQGALVENVVNRASVRGNMLVGGIAGKIENSGTAIGRVINSKNYGAVVSNTHYAAGITGALDSGKIINCANFGALTCSQSYGAGIAGRLNGGTIYNSYNAGTVSAAAYPGGIAGVPIGVNANDMPAIINCFNVGNLTSSGQVGGILGLPNNGVTKVYGCYNAGILTGSKTYPIAGNGATGSTTTIDLKNNSYLGNPAYSGDNGATKYEEITASDVAAWTTPDVSSNLLAGYPLSTWVKTNVKYPQLATNMFPADYDAPEDEIVYVGKYGEGVLIETAEDFMALAGNGSAVAYLAADIQLGTPTAPISNIFSFAGKLVGIKENGNYKITAYIAKDAENVGLFVSLTNAVIENIDIYGEIKVNGKDYVGALAGRSSNSTIINVCNNATVSGKQFVGGLVGRVGGNEGTTNTNLIVNCSNYGNINASAHYAAGLVGWAISGKVINSSNYGSVTGAESYSAGIVGRFDGGTIYNCYNAGAVTCKASPAGIAALPIGYVNGDAPAVLNCLNEGTITANSGQAGGIYSWPNAGKTYLFGNYNAGKIAGSKMYPIIAKGDAVNGTLIEMSDNRYLNNGAYTGNNGATIYSEVTAADVANWKISDASLAKVSSKISSEYPLSAWRISDLTGKPELVSNPTVVIQNGTAAFPYLITSKEDFMKIKDNNTAYYKIVKDIDLGSYVPFEFSGSLTADTMKTLTVDIDLPGDDNVGLFSKLINPVGISNIRVAGKITGNNNVGGIAGYMTYTASSASSAGVINNCENTAEVKAMTAYAGGILGKNDNVSNNSYEITGIGDCVNYGTIIVDSENGQHGAGGIVGINFYFRAAIQRCYNYGTIMGTTQCGGIAGYARANVQYCANYGEIIGTSRLGGIVGHKEGRGVSLSYNMASITGVSDSVGGLVGFADGGISIDLTYNAGNIYNFNDAYPSGTILGSNGSGQNYIKNSYNVGTVYNYCDLAPLSSLHGRNHSNATKEVIIQNSYAIGAYDSETTKTSESMKAFIPNGVSFEASKTAYPYAQIKTVKVNDFALAVYKATVNVTGEGKVNIANNSMVNNNDAMVIVLNPAEGGNIASVKVNGSDAEVVPVYDEEDGTVEYYTVTIDKVSSDVTLDVAFKTTTVTDAETVQAKVNTYTVTYFRPIIIENEVINAGTANEIELVKGVNYAIIMSQAETFEGYELVDFGVKNEDNYLTADPYITEDGEFGTLLYGNKIYSGNKLTFKPYIKLKNVVTGEETYFEGNAAEITIR